MFLRACFIFALASVMFLAPGLKAAPTDAAIIQLVLDTYQLDPEWYEIEVSSNRLKTKLFKPADLSFRPLSKKEPIGPFTLLVEVTQAGQLIEKGQVRLRIKRFAEVVVATDRIGRHRHLSEQQFEIKRIDVTSLREQPVRSLAQLVGQRSKRNLRMGNVLTTGAIEPVPDIEVGGEVTILFTDDWGSISVPGKALQAGWIGSKLRVKNLATGKVINAAVVSSTSVEVNP
jgi:flagella basal body P-ring formation protein FlgA